MTRTQLFLPLCLAAILGAPTGSADDCPPHPVGPPGTDNRDGYLPIFEEAPIHPMELGSQGDQLFVANLPGASVAVLDVDAAGLLSFRTEVPVGLGPVSVRRRPQALPSEVWVVCASSNAIFILSEGRKQVIDTIRVPFEPSGLVFDPTGSTAYVTLAASNQIAVIDAGSRSVDPLLEFQAEMPPDSDPETNVQVHAEEPRALILDGQDLYALSFKSGNGTLRDRFNIDQDPELDPFEIVDLWDVPGAPLPPDRDVLRFDVSAPAGGPDEGGDAVLWRMGTLNLDLLRRAADGHLWVSNVDLLNAARRHKFDYKANGFSVHRVSHAAPAAGNTPQASTTHIDLNQDIDPGLPADYRCAIPNAMALSPDESLLYVACYESRNAVVVDTVTDTVVAELRASSTRGFGSRGLVHHAAAGVVYVYGRADQSVMVFDDSPGVGTTNPPLQVVGAGFDITPEPIKAGRIHFIDATNSATQVESCNTCHLDGDLDGLAWDLGDFTGDLPGDPEPRDDNKLKVTMSLRGIEETPPYHWQGNRDDLVKFNGAFVGLLGADEELSEEDFADFQAFVFALSYPPNYKQDPDRVYSAEAQLGFGCFDELPAHDVSTDTTGIPGGEGDPGNPEAQMEVSCTSCHGMNGSSGTNNQVNNDALNPIPEDATQLRGLWDKESDRVFYGFVPLPATGWGFGSTHLSNINTVADFVDIFSGFFPEPERRAQITTFLDEFDTGMAPSTAFAWTLSRNNAGPLGAPLPTEPVATYQIPQAELGHSDLVVRGWLMLGGAVRRVGFLYDPSPGVQAFVADTSAIPAQSFADLVRRVREAGGTLTFLGAPVGSGVRLGLDADMDQLLDGDEPGHGTSASNPDSDRDGFPDGYEVRLGSDPDDPGSLPGADNADPQISGEAVGWENSQVARVRWATDEESPSRAQVVETSSATVVWEGEEPQPKTAHTMVVRGLDPGGTYDVVLEAEDPAGRTATSTVLAGVTAQPHLFESVHIQNTTLSQLAVGCTAVPGPGPGPIGQLVCHYLLEARFKVVDQDGQAVAGAVVDAKLVEWTVGGGTEPPQLASTSASNGSGVAKVNFTTQLEPGDDFTAEVMVDLAAASSGVTDADNKLYFHPLDGELQYWAALDLP